MSFATRRELRRINDTVCIEKITGDYYKTGQALNLTNRTGRVFSSGGLIKCVKAGGKVRGLITMEEIEPFLEYEDALALDEFLILKMLRQNYNVKHTTIEDVSEGELIKILGEKNLTTWYKHHPVGTSNYSNEQAPHTATTNQAEDNRQRVLLLFDGLPESIKNSNDIGVILGAMQSSTQSLNTKVVAKSSNKASEDLIKEIEEDIANTEKIMNDLFE